MPVATAKTSRDKDRPGSAGSAAIEFGVLAPMLLILVVGTVEVGYSAYQAMQVQNAVEAGALYAAKYGFDATKISNAVVNATNLTGIAASPAPAQFCGCPVAGGVTVVSCTSTCADGNDAGTYVQISAQASRQSIIAGAGLPLPATFTAQSIVRLN